MGDKCYDINPSCMAKAGDEARQPCPAYEQKMGCFELDWIPMYENLPAEQKGQMVQWMKSHCPACPVYAIHQARIDAKIAAM